MAEKEYIERGAAIAKCNKLINNADSCPNQAVLGGVELVRDLILTNCETGVPTADVVEVVRCKDCKYYEEGISGYSCFHPKQERGWNSEGGECLKMKPYDFCSYGDVKTSWKESWNGERWTEALNNDY